MLHLTRLPVRTGCDYKVSITGDEQDIMPILHGLPCDYTLVRPGIRAEVHANVSYDVLDVLINGTSFGVVQMFDVPATPESSLLRLS
jgi:hypothetical protein